MKRYVIFAAIGPLLVGFFMLLAGAPSGYWVQPDMLKKLVSVAILVLPYNYLFGIIPVLMIAAVDDILMHVDQIRPLLRMFLTGLIAFVATAVIYGTLGSQTGFKHYLLYGLIGFIPAALSSWLAHKFDSPHAVQINAQ